MTLDEAIEHCKEIARECELGEKPTVCAEEHWQLAEWLQSLKWYRETYIPICDDYMYWRDYRDDINEHPDYDGHCWLKGIMTWNVRECPECGKQLTVRDGGIAVDYGEEETK